MEIALIKTEKKVSSATMDQKKTSATGNQKRRMTMK